MMRIQKKVFAVAAAVLIAANAGLTVSAAEWQDWGGLKTCEDGVLTFFWFDGVPGVGVGCEHDDVTSIVIPESFEGMPVAYFPSSAFEECTQLQTITIPSTIISCTHDAFVDYACTNLTDVYYGGTEEQWYSLWCKPEGLEVTKENAENVIRFGGNEGLLNATIHFASSGDSVDVPVATPVTDGNGASSNGENNSGSTSGNINTVVSASSPKTGDNIWHVTLGAIASLGVLALLRKKR